MPASGIVAVGGPAEEEGREVSHNPRWYGHELSFDGSVSETVHDRWREECERSKWYAVAHIAKIVQQHPGAKGGFQNLLLRGMRFGVSPALYLDPVLDELLVVFAQPFSSSWVVGQEEHDQYYRADRDEAFDDE